MARKILFITTDQQRFDALGCNGGLIARTPTIDGWARSGRNYTRAYNQNTVCMPARSTMLTGQYVRTHGVVSNGIPLPLDAPDVARQLKFHGGYRTALIGKAHFEPASDPNQSYFENYAAKSGSTGPHRGFDHMELAGHTGRPGRSVFHYPKWLGDHHPQHVDSYYLRITPDKRVNGEGGGDSMAPQVWHNAIPRELYSTDWVADRSIDWLTNVKADDNWFLWMSFPDPHHPWDPPQSELHRCPWRDLDVPPSYPGSVETIESILREKPRHWLDWYQGKAQFNFEVPPNYIPAQTTADQIREVNAMVHISNELIDEACGRVVDYIKSRGWDEDTDIFYTTDHGELQGDFGMLFKGPYHVDSLMRVPMIWRPAPSANLPAATINEAVGHLDLAATFCDIAGVPADASAQGRPLPGPGEAGRGYAITEWDSDFDGNDLKLRSIYADGWVCTRYDATNYYAGTEGELYDVENDPYQWHNLWDEPSASGMRRDLLALLCDKLPAPREPALKAVALV